MFNKAFTYPTCQYAMNNQLILIKRPVVDTKASPLRVSTFSLEPISL